MISFIKNIRKNIARENNMPFNREEENIMAVYAENAQTLLYF